MTTLLQTHLPSRTLQWPARSPDLSPVENCWAEVKRKVAEAKPKPMTTGQLERSASRAWTQVTSDKGYVGKLYASMERRLKLVVKAKGGFVPY